MARCRKCGADMGATGRRWCLDCRKAWRETRDRAFDQAVAEIGPLSAATHAAIVKRVKQLERQFAKQEKP